MGCDIHGAIEYSFGNHYWFYVADVGGILNRCYDLFGLMFGVRNYCGFKPAAEGRGIPKNISTKCRDELKERRGDYHSSSWITFAELEKLKAPQLAEELDERVHIYSIGKNSKLNYRGKASSSGGINYAYVKKNGKNNEYKKGRNIYRLEKVSSKDTIDSEDFKRLYNLMKSLAGEYGKKNVRAVVWFDN